MFGHAIKRRHARIATVLVAAALFIGSLSSVSVAKAATLEELQAMIATLMAQIAALQAAPSGGTVQASSTNALHIGATITTTDSLRVRSAAGINALFIAIQPVGATGVIVEGPVVRDGYNWFKVDYATGTDGWNAGFWLRARTDAPDLKGTYVGYMDGRMFITTENISRGDALANCKLTATSNPSKVMRCTWRGAEMYISTETKSWPRIAQAMGPADASFVRATVVFGTPSTGIPAVTGPTKVGTINWGDGTAAETISALITGTQVSIERTHTYARNGSYTITATGLDGKTDTKTVSISTLPKPTTIGLYQGYKSGRLFVETANITKAAAQTSCQTNVASNPTTMFRCVWNGKVIFATGLIYENPDIPVRVLSVTNSKNPVITGTASGTGVVNIAIDNGSQVYAYSDILVNNGQWSHTVATDLVTGKYNLVVSIAVDNLNNRVAGRAFAIELTTETSATNTPDKNAFGCGRTVNPNAGTFANGFVGCYGMWDYGDTFGGDRFECGDSSAGKTGCMIRTKVCTSGYAKATAYFAGSDLTATKLNTVSARLNTTTEIAKNGIAGLWEYSCSPKPVTTTPAASSTTPTASSTAPGVVLGAATNVYAEIASTLAGIQAALANLK